MLFLFAVITAGRELWSPYLSQTTSAVFTAPGEFKFDGYQGNMNTWKGFGMWINQLSNGRRVLQEETKKEVQRLVQGMTNKEEVVRKVYEYMQSKPAMLVYNWVLVVTSRLMQLQWIN